MEKFFASIITIGDELLIGQTVDTNSAFIAQELNKIGVWVHRRVAVGDDYNEIWNVLDDENRRSQIVIITGGLGPTADDITKPLLCKYFNTSLLLNKDVAAHVKFLFESVYHRPEGLLLERNLKQAEVPENCKVLHNKRGTAPGMMWFNSFAIDKGMVVALPGVPYEMKGLIIDEVIPRIVAAFSLPAIVHRTALTAGQGESLIAETLQVFEASLPSNMKLAYLPSYGMVKLRLTATAAEKEALEKETAIYFDQLLLLLKNILVSEEDEPLEMVVGKILQQKGKTMGTAESCTGGYIAHLLTNIAGSSDYFKGSIVSYANEIKQNILQVPDELLLSHGAVSEQVVTAMLQGALVRLNVDYAIAVSGIMGPGGGSVEKPVGTVWIAAGNKNNIKTTSLNLRFDRKKNIETTALIALNFFRKFILNN